jgi:hypothetical protein
MSNGGVLQTLVSQERNEMIPKDATDHRGHDGATKLLLDVLQLIDKHTVVLLDLRMRTLFDFAHFIDTLNYRAIRQIKCKHVAHAGSQILSESIVGISIKTLCHHTHINKIWDSVRVAMAIDAKPPGPLGYPTLLSQWVLFITMWQIQKQPHSGGILRTASIF